MKNTVVVAYSTSNESKSLRINISQCLSKRRNAKIFSQAHSFDQKNVLPGFFSCSVLFRLKESGRMEPTVQM